jgi:hypothetical protein
MLDALAALGDGDVRDLLLKRKDTDHDGSTFQSVALHEVQEWREGQLAETQPLDSGAAREVPSLRDAAKALLNAYGGNVPEWLTSDYRRLEAAVITNDSRESKSQMAIAADVGAPAIDSIVPRPRVRT